MRTRTLALASALAAASALSLAAAPAAAYTVCNRDGDCWHTDTRVHFPHVRLSFHNDKWWDAHRNNARYHWHDMDNDHDWHHGYWSHGEWHST
jgi:hypothetical protein